MLRSILAVIVGYLVLAIPVFILFFAWFGGYNPQNLPEPGMGFMLFSLVFGFVFAGGGGYVCALIARRSEMNHAVALAALIVAMSIISIISAAGNEPLWYQLATLVIAVMAVLIGGFVRAGQVAKASA